MDRRTEDRPVKVVKWAWRHHSIDADVFDSIEAAVLAAKWAADYGEEALDCIEVIESGVSRILTPEEYDAIVKPIEEAEWRSFDARPKATTVLRLASPSGEHWTTYEGFASAQDAEAAAEEFRQTLGASRVKVEPVRVPFSL